MKIIDRIAERIGRRVWIRRIDVALHGAYRTGHIDTWTLHEIDGFAKYEKNLARPFRFKCPACFHGGSVHHGGTTHICKNSGAAPGGGTERGT